ncbi:MAG: hypothetical protein Q9187_002982 [Circinaria calcarea]
MSAMAPHNDIVLFHYSSQLQPPTLPREDLNALGVKYRRIPVMSIGRDIYCDTRLILQKLEERFPDGALGASQPDQRAIEKLLEIWCIDGGVFARAAQLIPPELPLLNDPKFTKDREEYTGRSWAKSDLSKMRPEALAAMREAFDFLETGFLSDGREWILKTQGPSMADIEAVWPFHWLQGMKGALPPEIISEEQYPKVFAWIDRFDKAVSTAKSSSPKPTTLKGAEAVRHITQADYVDTQQSVDENEPLGLKEGQEIEVWPLDSGFRHHDRGRLVALTSKEVVVASPTKIGGKEVRIHCPRTNFRIQAVSEAGAKL